jgi:hypothetical protein
MPRTRQYDKFSGFPPETEKANTVADAITSCIGVSRGSSHTIPRLLMKEVPGFALTELKDLRYIGVEVFEGIRCHHLIGHYPHPRGNRPEELWIGVDDFLLRKNRSIALYGASEEEIHRNIKVNI